jgi:leader peptidase (prepilin peptidase) / N-methyltransferase
LAVGAVIGAALTSVLVRHGRHRLALGQVAGRRLSRAGALAGCTAGAVAIDASSQVGTWLVVPGLMVWACALVAAAACDAFTKRVPTWLVRPAGLVTSLLLTTGLLLNRDWHGLLQSGIAAASSGLILGLCWRFAGAGFGDARLATLGGLGLGHATLRGGALALLLVCMIVLIQATVALTRAGNRHNTVPLGPALAVGFLVAAAL